MHTMSARLAVPGDIITYAVAVIGLRSPSSSVSEQTVLLFGVLLGGQTALVALHG